MASIPVITKYLALFQELYPTRELTNVTAEAWEFALADVGDRGFVWAADKLLREPGRTFFPTPNEIRGHMSVYRGRVTDSGPSRIGAGDIGDILEPISEAQQNEWNRVKAALKAP